MNEESTIEKMCHMWSLVAKMNAVIASIEAMKASNAQYPENQPYGDDAFSNAYVLLNKIGDKLGRLA